jgi:hypothetical protein
MRKILIFLAALLLLSCKSSQTQKSDLKYFEEFYTVLEYLISYKLENVSAIGSETMPVYRTQWGNEAILSDTISPPPPPPVGYHSLGLNSLKSLLTDTKDDSIDIDFIYHSIDSTKTFSIDPNKIAIPVITKGQFQEYFKSDIHEGYKTLKKIYGSSCYILVSTPIFNEDFTKLIIFIDYQCGPLWGQGSEFLLIKKDGKWRLIAERGTWVS